MNKETMWILIIVAILMVMIKAVIWSVDDWDIGYIMGFCGFPVVYWFVERLT